MKDVAMNYDDIIPRAQSLYAKRAQRAHDRNGISHPIISDRGWYVEEHDDDTYVTAYTTVQPDPEPHHIAAQWRVGDARLIPIRTSVLIG